MIVGISLELRCRKTIKTWTFLLPYRGFMFPVIAVESATEIKPNAWIIGKD